MKELHTSDILEIEYLRKNTIKDYHEYKLSKLIKENKKESCILFT